MMAGVIITQTAPLLIAMATAPLLVALIRWCAKGCER